MGNKARGAAITSMTAAVCIWAFCWSADGPASSESNPIDFRAENAKMEAQLGELLDCFEDLRSSQAVSESKVLNLAETTSPDVAEHDLRDTKLDAGPSIMLRLYAVPERVHPIDVARDPEFNPELRSPSEEDLARLRRIIDVFSSSIQELQRIENDMRQKELEVLRQRGILDSFDPFSESSELGEKLRARYRELLSAGKSQDSARSEALKSMMSRGFVQYRRKGKTYFVPSSILVDSLYANSITKLARQECVLTVMAWALGAGLISHKELSSITDRVATLL